MDFPPFSLSVYSLHFSQVKQLNVLEIRCSFPATGALLSISQNKGFIVEMNACEPVDDILNTKESRSVYENHPC